MASVSSTAGGGTSPRSVIPDKDFDEEYRRKGAYHRNPAGFTRVFLRRNYALLRRFVGERATILHLGCGEGEFGARVADGQRVVGLDRSATALRFAHRSGRRHYVQGAIPLLPFRAACFDAVVSSLTLQYVPPAEWDVLLEEVRRVLINGGLFCFSYINAAHVSVRDRLSGSPAQAGRTVAIHSTESLFAVLSRHGWRVRRFVGTNLRVPYDALPSLLRGPAWAIAVLLGHPFPRLSYHFVVLAEPDARRR